MKYLQDLVPGCNNITGKAGMLDEIINYVQSLQRQVEVISDFGDFLILIFLSIVLPKHNIYLSQFLEQFLSMKLAAVNPRLDFNIDNLFAKEVSKSFHKVDLYHPK